MGYHYVREDVNAHIVSCPNVSTILQIDICAYQISYNDINFLLAN